MINNINIADYSYDLPEEKIAKYPLKPRDSSKLLHYNRGNITSRIFRELPELISKDNLLVFNDTKVIQARLKFTKSTGAKIEIFCLEPHDPPEYNLAFQKTSESVWKCLVGNAKKWKNEVLRMRPDPQENHQILLAEKTGRDRGAFLIRFRWKPSGSTFGDILEKAGNTPIPPYMKREAEQQDRHTYQTVYSRYDGSVAAPTAGLHFTDSVLSELRKKNIPSANLTLHVGAGTFQPVSSDTLIDHPMHAEHFFINREFLENLLNHEGKVLAIGTTSTRVLESLYWLGVRLEEKNGSADPSLYLEQWDPYTMSAIKKEKSLENLLGYMDDRGQDSLEGLTRLMIVPGYEFRMIDCLLTNYHQPKSTLLLLVAAFIGEDWRRVYEYALNNDFRFLSYGDSSLLIPRNK